MSNRKIKSL